MFGSLIINLVSKLYFIWESRRSALIINLCIKVMQVHFEFKLNELSFWFQPLFNNLWVTNHGSWPLLVNLCIIKHMMIYLDCKSSELSSDCKRVLWNSHVFTLMENETILALLINLNTQVTIYDRRTIKCWTLYYPKMMVSDLT